jgi:hypothetical protein
MKSKSLLVAFLASAALIAQAKTTVDDWPDWSSKSYKVPPRDTTPLGVTCPDAIGCDFDVVGLFPPRVVKWWWPYAPNADHVLYVPYCTDDVHHSKLLVMLGGGNSVPDQEESHQIYKVAAACGYHVIGLSYFDRNSDEDRGVPGLRGTNSCKDDLDCYGDYMKEVVDGTNCASATCGDDLNFESHRQDTINNRLLMVLQWAAREHPDDGWEPFLVSGPNSRPSVNWKLVTVGGFSNGSSYAAFLGLQYPDINRVALLNGPNDGHTKSRIWKAANYLKKQPGLTDTRYYALIHYLNHEDELYKQIGVYNALGMEGWTIFDPEPNEVTDYNGAHVLLSIDSKTCRKNGHTSVVRDEYKEDCKGCEDCEECEDCVPTGGDPFACTIGYEEAWRYIIGDGRIPTKLSTDFTLPNVQAQAGESTFSCIKTDSDVALELKVTNNGPDAVSNCKTVHYFYKTSANGQAIRGTYTLTRKVKKGETFKILISPSWQTPVVSCGVSLKPFGYIP